MLALILALQIVATAVPPASAMPPLPTPVGHTLTIEVPAPTREVAELDGHTVYLEGSAVGIPLAPMTCLPVVLPAIPWSKVYACTGELPKMANGFHALTYAITRQGLEGARSAPVPFIYQAPPPTVPAGK